MTAPEQSEFVTTTSFRAIVAEAMAVAFLLWSDPGSRLDGVDPAVIRQRALNQVLANPILKMALSKALDTTQQAAMSLLNGEVTKLLQHGMKTMDRDGHMVTVERLPDKLQVTNILTGAGLDVSDGAFVIFIDSRSASGNALKRWQALVKDDTRLMVIPLQPPDGQTVAQCVAAKRQEEDGFVG